MKKKMENWVEKGSKRGLWQGGQKKKRAQKGDFGKVVRRKWGFQESF